MVSSRYSQTLAALQSRLTVTGDKQQLAGGAKRQTPIGVPLALALIQEALDHPLSVPSKKLLAEADRLAWLRVWTRRSRCTRALAKRSWRTVTSEAPLR